MKSWKILAILLLCAALLATPLLAAEPDVAPWAVEAVDFAVAQGMMSPEEQRPRDPATRAELAHMLVALFNARLEDDLSGCTDVEKNARYAPDLAKAVALGVYEGGKPLYPRRALTREETFQVLARCFGVKDGDRKVLARFSDSDALNEWAAGPVAGMIEAAYIQGADDKLDPQGKLARQDLANLIYRIVGSVPGDGALPESGNVVVPVGATVPAGAKVKGNLIVCAGDEPLVLKDVEIAGCLVIHSGTVRLEGTTAAGRILCRGYGVRLSGGAMQDVAATYGSLNLESGDIVSLSIGDASVGLHAGVKAAYADLNTAFSVLSGAGRVEEAFLHDPGAKLTARGVEVFEEFTAPVETVKIAVRTPLGETKPESRNTSTTVRFEDVGDKAGRYILAWYMDGKLVSRDWSFELKDGATATLNAEVPYASTSPEKVSVMVRLSDGSKAAMLTQSASRHLEMYGPAVDTMRIEATVLYKTGLYRDYGMTDWMGEVEAGTVVTYADCRSHMNTLVNLPDGRIGFVAPYAIRPSEDSFVQKQDYTTYQKERYVNQTNDFASDTGLLVWLSRRTQKVNVFQGGKGNWKLIHTFDCCSGKNTTPTLGGVYKYYSRTNRWDFGTYFVNNPMLFNGGHAFHTRTYIYGQDGVLLDATIGEPRSQGCVRMYDQDVMWLWDNMPMGTTVVVF